MMKETIRQNGNEAQGRAEVISAIRNIQNKDEVFAVLTRSNKELNRKGIKISATGGEITLNGHKIDFSEFSSMNKKEATTFLSNISQSEPTFQETTSTRIVVSEIFPSFSMSDVEAITNCSMKLLSFCSGDVKKKIISALASLLASLTFSMQNFLDELFPNHSKYISLLNMVIGFFARKADELQRRYDMWQKTKDEQYYSSVFRFISLENTSKAVRTVKFFEQAVNMYYNGVHLCEFALKELITDLYNFIAEKTKEYLENKETAEERQKHSARSPTNKVRCRDCGGYYYQLRNTPM